MKVIDCEQGSPEWFAARAGRISASRFPDLMGRLRNGDKGAGWKGLVADLAVERLTGHKMETYSNAAMQRGIELEPEARAAYENENMLVVEEVGTCIHDELDYVSASPDGLIGDDGLLEIKCMNARNHADSILRGYHASTYRWQVQGQLMVTGRDWCDLVAYHPEFPEHRRLVITRITPDADDFVALREACVEANEAIEELKEQLA